MEQFTTRCLPVLVSRLAAIATILLGAHAPVAGQQIIWFDREIGNPSGRGSARLDAAGVWTVQGGGTNAWYWPERDDVHYVHRAVTGDITFSARFLSMTGGHAEWAKAGLMIRESDAAGAPNVFLCMALGHGLHASARFEQDEPTGQYWEVGPTSRRERGLRIRLQRLGSEVAGYYSRDGILWSQAFGPAPMRQLPEEVQIGLAVTSHQNGVVTTAQFDEVAVQPGGALVYGILGCGGDRSVLLQWRPLKNAVSYNIYRGPYGATRDQLVKLNAVDVAGTSYTDTSEALVNGTPQAYGVAALLRAFDGTLTEGPIVVAHATPQSIPRGWAGCSILEGTLTGAAFFDPVTGEITLQGSGGDVWNNGDQLFYLEQPVEGDAQITAQLLERPALTSIWAKAGLMIRESIEPGARNVFAALSANQGVITQWRLNTDGLSEITPTPAIRDALVTTPITLRLTRRGNVITSEVSTDGGKTFRSAGPRLTFAPPLARTLLFGPAICATNRNRLNLGRFTNVEIKKL